MSDTVTLRHAETTVFYTVLNDSTIRRRLVVRRGANTLLDDVTIMSDLGGEAEAVVNELITDRLDEGFERA